MLRLLPLLLATAALTAHAAPTPAQPPARLPGLWLMNTGPAGEAAKVSSFHLCVGKQGGDDVLAYPGSPLANCREQQWSKDAHYTYYRAVCDARGSSAQVEARFAGDFQYNFHGEITTTYSPALEGQTVAKREIDGRRLSPCRADTPEGKFLIKGQEGVGNLNLGEPVRQPAR